MNKIFFNQLLSFVFIAIISGCFFSCSKINSTTYIGSELIPPIDGIHTFETSMPIEIDNKWFADTTSVGIFDDLAIGDLNDPVFGATTADAYFDITYNQYGTYPFINRDSVTVDSVVLSLGYQGAYGDTLAPFRLKVFEISQSSEFNNKDRYFYSRTEPFATTGAEMGSATFVPAMLRDTMELIYGTDTIKTANQIRIKLDNSLGNRLVQYDTTDGYKNDSLFKLLFRGFAIKTSGDNKALVYFRPSNDPNTNITVYYRVVKNGTIDTTFASFYHNPREFFGLANNIKRTPAAEWNDYLTNTTPQDDKGYIASMPGSYTTVKIPGLDTMKNAVIHGAELIFPKLSSIAEATFTAPVPLYLDRLNNTGDTVFTFDNDINLSFNNTQRAFVYDPNNFGGFLRSDNTYRFTLTRYVQSVVIKKSANAILRLHAPTVALFWNNTAPRVNIGLRVLDKAAEGRVVVQGGLPADVLKGARLRIVYSKL